jgi:tRNA nucleotidyltransferase (CCA-adding enzyme)
MKKFSNWLKESSLGDILNVPQNPKNHPEGSVYRHTKMVRAALNPAIKLLQSKQEADPSGPLSNLDLNFNQADINILRLGALLHDIGKGEALNPITLSAHGHETPEVFEKAMKGLGDIWKYMYDKADQTEKDDLWWIIKYHMSLKDDVGFQNKALKKELLDDNGKYRNERRVKLLLVLLLMDRMGRGGESGFNISQARQFAQSNIEAGQEGLSGIYTTSDAYLKDLAKMNKNKVSFSSPAEMISALKQKGTSRAQIIKAVKGKFKLSDEDADNLVPESVIGFRSFMESQDEMPYSMSAKIPLGKFEEGAALLNRIFKENNKTFYVVGGTVRDYLMSYFHNATFSIKDVDFATDALTPEVINILENAGIQYVAKGESFGVISAIINKQEFEIATFREEAGYSDRRRPDIVKASDAKNDYRRRDFTFNALFYDMPLDSNAKGQIIDFGGGKGIEDIKQMRVRTVGKPEERFAEDPLRVLRGVRFHGIFNDKHLRDVLDPETFEAMKSFSDLEGVSPERIQAEFLSALIKAKDPKVILHGFKDIGALPAMFPNMDLDMEAVDRLDHLPMEYEGGQKDKHNYKKIVLTLSLLLRKIDPNIVRQRLNELKWPNIIVDEVVTLISTWSKLHNPTNDSMSQHALSLYKKNPDLRRELMKDFVPMIGHEVETEPLHHLSNYEPAKFDSAEVQWQHGVRGKELGEKLRKLHASHYGDSWVQYKNAK